MVPAIGCQTDPRAWGVYLALSSRYWLDLVRLDVHISDVLHVGGALKTGREHAVVTDLYDPDVRLNTRTVEAPFWQRFCLHPTTLTTTWNTISWRVFPATTCQNYDRTKAKRRSDGVPVVSGYGQVLKMAVAS